jgi:hypothetical protein
MDIEYYANLIQEIVDKAAEKKNFASSKEQLLWRYGFAVGLLARFAKEDNYLASKIEHYHEQITGKKRR